MLGVAPGPHLPLSLAAEPPKPKRVLRNAVRLLLVPGKGDRRVDSSARGVLGLELSAVPGQPRQAQTALPVSTEYGPCSVLPWHLL